MNLTVCKNCLIKDGKMTWNDNCDISLSGGGLACIHSDYLLQLINKSTGIPKDCPYKLEQILKEDSNVE
jgi:hypothetical protein